VLAYSSRGNQGARTGHIFRLPDNSLKLTRLAVVIESDLVRLAQLFRSVGSEHDPIVVLQTLLVTDARSTENGFNTSRV
jgi:hypothetical protein